MRIVSLVAVCAMLLAGCATREPGRLLFVVPDTLPDGTPATEARAALEVYLAETAGGYTRLDEVTGGWMSPAGVVVTEPNDLYLVSPGGADPAELRAEIERRILEDFDQQAAYIERW